MFVRFHVVQFHSYAGEQGELVGKIVRGDPMREFDGYVNADASMKKIASDIFAKGDRYFLTGRIFFSFFFYIVVSFFLLSKYGIKFRKCTMNMLRLYDHYILIVQ